MAAATALLAALGLLRAAHAGLAEELNSLHNDEESGVFLRLVGEGWIRPWEGCESWSLPCAAYSRVGRLSFLVLNRLYWGKQRGQLLIPDDGILEKGQTADMGFIGTEEARLAAARCMFTIDGWTEFRFNDGCGCTTQSTRYVKMGPLKNFSQHQTDGWQGHCHQPNHEAWCTSKIKPRMVGLSSPIDCPERFGCAWRSSELKELMRDYKANRSVIPHICEQWNEVVIDATRWNAGLASPETGIRAFFVRKDKCMPGSKCYADFLRWTGQFQEEHGERPVVVLDVFNETQPFSLLREEPMRLLFS